MDGKTVYTILLKCVGYKLFLVHHVFCEGAFYAQRMCSAFLLALNVAFCHVFKFTVKAVYYNKTVACGDTLEEL